MSQAILDRFAAQQGWNEQSQRDLLERYIENQASDDAFEEHVQNWEGEDDERATWSDDTWIACMMEYIERQDSDDAFADFLAVAADDENHYEG